MPLHLARGFLVAADRLKVEIKDRNIAAHYQRTLSAIAVLTEVLQEEFELDRAGPARKRRAPEERRLQKALWYQKKSKQQTMETLSKVKGDKH